MRRFARGKKILGKFTVFGQELWLGFPIGSTGKLQDFWVMTLILSAGLKEA